MESSMSQTASPRSRLAELTSTSGAGVFGIGVGALGAHYLEGLGLPLLLTGFLLHAWGMTDKHRLVKDTAPVWWATLLYWFCWALLLTIVAYALLRSR